MKKYLVILTSVFFLAPNLVAAAPYIAILTANGAAPLLTVNQGDLYTVNWDAGGAISWCRLSYAGDGPFSVAGGYPGDPSALSGSYIEPHTSAYGPSSLIGTYTFACADPAGDVAWKQVTIKVKPPVVNLFTDIPGTDPYTLPANGRYTLTYGSGNSSGCTLSWVSSEDGTSGSTNIPVSIWASGTTQGSGASGLVGTYTYTCNGWNGEHVSKSVTIRNPGNNLSCSITFDQNPIPSDGSTTIHWSSTNAQLFYINNVGYVGASGSATVAPEETTDFSGYVNDEADGTGITAQCTGNTVLTVSGTDCPAGQELQGGVCLLIACPSGYVREEGACVRSNVCSAPPRCSGDDLVDGCTHSIIQSCAHGCASGACIVIPAPTATLSASPSLVHSGDTTVVSWTSQNTSSCNVIGSNGDSWTGLTSSGKTSQPILAQTIYNLHCVGLAGATPSAVDRSVTVNLIPIFNEK